MRTAALELTYDAADISTAIAPYVVSFAFSDNASGKADDLQITLDDRDQRWKNEWHPTKGATLRAAIVATLNGKESRLDCGVFEIDEITSSGPPDQVVLRAASAGISRSLRREKKSKAWENISLQGVAAAIAVDNGLAFFYDGALLDFTRLDQRDESDLAFLKRLCDDNGLNLKVADEKLIVFSGQNFDALPAAFTITRGQSRIKTYDFKDKADDVYNSCQVSYQDPATKEVSAYVFTPPNAPQVGQMLKVTARVESQEAANRLAMTRLRSKNKQEVTATISMEGDTAAVAGLNVALSGWGFYDGTYFIDKAEHSQGSGYATTLTLRKVLAY